MFGLFFPFHFVSIGFHIGFHIWSCLLYHHHHLLLHHHHHFCQQLGYARPLEDDDVWKLDQADRAALNEGRFTALWEEETKRPSPKIVSVFVRMYGTDLFVSWLWKAFNDGSQFAGPIILKVRSTN